MGPQVHKVWKHVLGPPLAALVEGTVHVWRHPELWLVASLALLGGLYVLHVTGVVDAGAAALAAALAAVLRLLVRTLLCSAGPGWQKQKQKRRRDKAPGLGTAPASTGIHRTWGYVRPWQVVYLHVPAV